MTAVARMTAGSRTESSILLKETILQSNAEGLESVILCSLAASGDVETLQAVLQENPTLDVSKGGRISLIVLDVAAAEKGHLECVRILVDRGARLNCIDKFGSTPLRGAVSARHEEVVQFLKSKGATLYLDSFVQSDEMVGSRAFTDNELEHLRVVFNSIDPAKPEKSHTISEESIKAWLKKNVGFQLKKHKIAMKELEALEGDGGEGLAWRQFLRAMRKPTLLTRAFKDELAVGRWENFRQSLKDIFNHVKKTVPATLGKKSTFIPELQNVDKEEFGCAVCTVDGQMFTVGTEEDFSLQACVFPVLYAQLVEKLGYDEFHRNIGKEPSGAYHNAITLNSEGKPHNALVDTGAVVMCRMFEPQKTPSERFKSMLTYASELAATKLGFSQTVYLSEKAAAYQPLAMAHYMASKGALSSKRSDIESAMDLYFQLSSIEANCEKLAVIAATFANNGCNPLTGKVSMQQSTVKQTTALLHSCGMYIASGEWACNVGLPAKSGISGALWMIVPGVCGIAIYAPPIDANSTSVRGAALAQAIADRFSWNIFDVLHSASS